MMVFTARKELRACKLCGLEVEHEGLSGLFRGEQLLWRAVDHDSPCGAPCFGGGARGARGLAAYKKGAMHGLQSECPNCGKKRGE